jgi:O-succinylbenzoic acid--CoA ligase
MTLQISVNGYLFNVTNLQHLASTYSTEFEKSLINLILRWQGSEQNFSLTTSGSTGAPKPITITRNQLQASAKLTIEALDLKPTETSLICLDTRYIAGQMMVIRSLENNMNMIAVEPSADPLQTIPASQKIDFAALVPYQLQAILQSTESTQKLNLIRNVIIGGATLDDKVKSKLQSLQCNIYSTYGMTETITHIALQRLNGVDKQNYFQTLKGISIDQDERQCLVIEAAHFTEKIITNDIVQLLDYNKFIWLGRYDNVINSGGIKIIPEKIEPIIAQVFEALNLHHRFFVTGLPNEKLGNKVVLLVEGKITIAAREIIKMLAQNLSKYEVPKEIYFISRFYETETQKINRIKTLNLINKII